MPLGKSWGAFAYLRIAEAPYLDVVAAMSEDGSRLLLFCVNRNLNRPERASFEANAISSLGRTARVTTITGDRILAENNELQS